MTPSPSLIGHPYCYLILAAFLAGSFSRYNEENLWFLGKKQGEERENFFYCPSWSYHAFPLHTFSTGLLGLAECGTPHR
jgi:hypothetical protein